MNELEQEILQVALKRSAALVRGDAQTLERLLAEGFVYTNASNVMNKEEYLETYLASGDMRWEAQELEDVRIRLYGHTAILTARIHDRASYQGQTFDAYFQTTQVCLKNVQGWECVATQTTLVPAPK